MGGLRTPSQALHHLQLKRQVFFRLHHVCLCESVKGLEVTLLLTKKLLYRLDRDLFDFY
jgi:hypothetical protein